jgi:hypothetical protein
LTQGVGELPGEQRFVFDDQHAQRRWTSLPL